MSLTITALSSVVEVANETRIDWSMSSYGVIAYRSTPTMCGENPKQLERLPGRYCSWRAKQF